MKYEYLSEENKKRVNDARNSSIKSVKESTAFITITNKNLIVSGSEPNILSLFSCLVESLKDRVDKDLLKQSFELGMLNEEDRIKKMEKIISSELENLLKTMKENKKED